MVDAIMKNYSNAIESTLNLQHEMLRSWTKQRMPFGTEVSGLPPTAISAPASVTTAGWLEQLSSAQKKCTEAVTDMLNRHRETLDEQYRARIRAIEDAFRIGEVRGPEGFRRLSEELWRRNCEILKTAVASQMHDVESVIQKWYEAALGSGGN